MSANINDGKCYWSIGLQTSAICLNNQSAIYSIISSGDEWEQGRHKLATYDLLLNLTKLTNKAKIVHIDKI